MATATSERTTSTVTPPPTTLSIGESIDYWQSRPMGLMKDEWERLHCRFITGKPEGAWDDFILSEWEVRGCAWEDYHPHTETNFVVEGELHIETEGKTVVLKPGDSARVNPGRTGRYWAPVYARMVTIYGPNPEGLESHSFKYYEL